MQFEMPTPLQALLPALRLQPQKLAANVPEPSRAGPGRHVPLAASPPTGARGPPSSPLATR